MIYVIDIEEFERRGIKIKTDKILYFGGTLRHIQFESQIIKNCDTFK